jgi:pimeloyl-ACP methyl ester carboxylesterase
MIAAMLALAAGVFQPAPCAMDLPEGFEQKHQVQCGWVAVPLQHGTAGGKSIRLWTARIRATGAHSHDDPVLYINGGPGIATVETMVPAIADSKTMAMLRQGRDLIVFDQRGSGRSEQALCPTLAKRLDAIESAGLAADAEAARSQAAFVECRAFLDATGADLEAYTTSATVLDMEVLRKAFQVDRWNLVSISYGSLVAMHAMRVAPGSVRSVILNSPYPPNSVTWAEQSSSAAAAYAAIDRQCSALRECHNRYGTLLPKLEATLARLERVPRADGKSLITGRRFADALWPMTVNSMTVRFVPLAIERAYSGDEAIIKAMVAKYASGESFGGYSPAQAMAISCHESGRTSEWNARARALYPGLVSADPDDSWDRLCEGFRPGFADPSFFAPVVSDIPTLIYAGALDPATPTVDAYQAMRFLKHATLVEVADAAHGPMGIDECTRGIAAAFLADPASPPDRACIATRRPI